MSEVTDSMADVWRKRVKDAEKNFTPAFKQMERNMNYVAKSRSYEVKEEIPEDVLESVNIFFMSDKYFVPIAKNAVEASVAAIYARNPEPVVKRRKRILNTIWDGTIKHITEAKMFLEEVADIDPNKLTEDQLILVKTNKAVVEDFERCEIKKSQTKRLATSLEKLMNYYINEPHPEHFKAHMEDMIRRSKTNGVAYVKLDFRRSIYDTDPSKETITISEQKAHTESVANDVEENSSIDDVSEELKPEELELQKQGLIQQRNILTREGLVFTYPKSDAIIVDPDCMRLEDFVGAKWIAERYMLTPSDINKYYQVDIRKNIEGADASAKSKTDKTMQEKMKVWEVYDKLSGQVFTIADGYKGYLRAPAPPDVSVEGFFPYIALVFGKRESKDKIYFPSLVEEVMGINSQWNKQRDSINTHRNSNVPIYIAIKGSLDNDEKQKIEECEPHSVVFVKADGDKDLQKIIQPIKKEPVDPMVYSTKELFEDLMLTTGLSAAQLGSITGATATETSIAQASTDSTNSKDADTLNSFLVRLFAMSGRYSA